MSAPFLYRAWVGASVLALPIFARSETKKLTQAGLSAARAREKLGHATVPRPGDGPLIWFHAASVGESLSVLSLITRMGVALPQAHFLITSGTATSAQLVARRLPPRTQHQFAPLDAPGPLSRFLAHWQPDAALFVESELWPQMLRRTKASGARLALVNARLSERSQESWRKRPALARYLFEVFDLILTQNDPMARAMVEMHAPAERVARGINLKSMSDPLPIDAALRAQTAEALANRPVWVASSTHPGEEEVVLQAHRRLLRDLPDLMLILAPRHPDRGDAVAEMISAANLPYTRRSQGEALGAKVYLADTMGELGTWYALTDVVFLGGSLKPIGGHNPFEVAQAGAAVFSGPHVANFAETFAELEACGVSRFVSDGRDLAHRVSAFLTDADAQRKAKAAAAAFAQAQTDQLDAIAQRLINALELS